MQQRGKADYVVGLAAILAIIVIWSGWSILSRWGLLEAQLGANELVLLRLGFAGVAMLPVLWRIGLGGIGWEECLILALTTGPGYAICTYHGLRYAPAAHGAALTAGILPVFTTLFACWAGQLRHPSRGRMVGLVIIVLAASCFIVDGLSGEARQVWLGDLLLMCGPLLWAIYTVRVTKLQVDPVRATAIVSVFGCLLFLPVYTIWGEPSRLLQVPLSSLLFQGFWHGIVVVIGSLTLYTFAVHKVGQGLTTAGTSTVPAVTAISAWLILGESLSSLLIVAVILAAIGLITVSRAITQEGK
ncbi:MAG: DMT family transporter [Verrucomicrobiota bacterium]